VSSQALGTVNIPDATPESELSQVLAILGALAAENDKSTLLAVLQGLSPQVLADCVIANMAHLPAADTIVGTGGSAGLAGLMQVHLKAVHPSMACLIERMQNLDVSRPVASKAGGLSHRQYHSSAAATSLWILQRSVAELCLLPVAPVRSRDMQQWHNALHAQDTLSV